MALLAFNTSMVKSGAYPVSPNTVVFIYFAEPAKSMNVIIFDEFSQISSAERQFPKF